MVLHKGAKTNGSLFWNSIGNNSHIICPIIKPDAFMSHWKLQKFDYITIFCT